MWYIHIFALFELYLEQSNDKPNYLVVPLTEAASQFPQKLNPLIQTLLIIMLATVRGQKQPKYT